MVMTVNYIRIDAKIREGRLSLIKAKDAIQYTHMHIKHDPCTKSYYKHIEILFIYAKKYPYNPECHFIILLHNHLSENTAFYTFATTFLNFSFQHRLL